MALNNKTYRKITINMPLNKNEKKPKNNHRKRKNQLNKTIK